MPNYLAPDAAPDAAPAAAPARPVHTARPGALDSFLATLPEGQSAHLRTTGFTAAAGELALLPGEGGLEAVLGLGEDRTCWTHAGLPFTLPEGVWRLEPGDFEMDQAVLGWALGAYRFTRFKPASRVPARLVGAAVHTLALATAGATALARDLINTPANHQSPMDLARAAQDLAARHPGATCTVVEGDALTASYPALAAVGAGSDRPPAVAILRWSGGAADAPLLSLCGKGVVFDTGGYDLKPSAAMLRMKKDMGGAALMLALASLVMDQALPIRLELRLGCVENSVSGRAMRPLDVLATRRGLTVEVGNTDAEGRLVLADLLAEASDATPDLLVDAATLTGAARVALGPDLPAFMTPQDELADRFMQAAAAAHDPVWRLPLWPGYDPWLASPVANMGNVAGKPMAGAIVAGLFLQRFVRPGTPWLHIDTYAWNDQTRPGRPEGGEALALRALYAIAETLRRFNSNT